MIKIDLGIRPGQALEYGHSAHGSPLVAAQHGISAGAGAEEFSRVTSRWDGKAQGFIAIQGGTDMEVCIVEGRGPIE
jgi:hypothetical protein